MIIIFGILKWVGSTSKPPEIPLPPEVTTPANDTPSSTVTTTKVVELLDQAYAPTTNPFETNEYTKVPRIVYGGSFSGVTLFVSGDVLSQQGVFLLLNFGKETGIINGVRKDERHLDVAATAAKGGLYSVLNPIAVKVNLQETELGTSSFEYSKSRQSTKQYQFISAVESPNVFPLVVIPFDANGAYGGGRITSLRVEYVCKSEGSCVIAECPVGSKSTQCITDEFNAEEAAKWQKKSGL